MLKDRIKKLIGLIEDTEIEEIEVSSFWGAQKIRLSKSKSFQKTVVPSQSPDILKNNDTIVEDSKSDIVSDPKSSNINLSDTPLPHSQEEDYSDESKFKIITAPLVGTFYSCPKPGDPPYINIGEHIDKGMTVCIIEAMKIFNEIEAEVSGKVIKIIANDSSPVEYGQPLMLVEPS